VIARRAELDRGEIGKPGARLVEIDRHRAGRAEQLQRIGGAGDKNAATEVVAVFEH